MSDILSCEQFSVLEGFQELKTPEETLEFERAITILTQFGATHSFSIDALRCVLCHFPNFNDPEAMAVQLVGLEREWDSVHSVIGLLMRTEAQTSLGQVCIETIKEWRRTKYDPSNPQLNLDPVEWAKMRFSELNEK